MYLIGKIFQRRTCVWFSVELLHTSFTRKASIASEFLLFSIFSDSRFNVFWFYMNVQSFPFLYGSEPALSSLRGVS